MGNAVLTGPYKAHISRTGQCMNHALAIWAVPAYNMHRVLVVWIIVANFYLCSPLGMLSCYTILEVWAVRWLMHVCRGSRLGWCVLFISILDGYRSTRHMVMSSHGQLVTLSCHHMVNSSPVNSSHTRLITQSARDKRAHNKATSCKIFYLHASQVAPR